MTTKANTTDTSAAVADGWRLVPCPLCGELEQPIVFEADYLLFDTQARVTLRRCQCGMQLTNPQPFGETLAKFYATDAYYTHAAKTGLRAKLRKAMQRRQLRGPLASLRLWAENSFGLQRFTKRFAPHVFPLNRGLKLLDFGCGAGHTLARARELGLEAIGVEPDEKARHVATDAGGRVFASLEELDEQSPGMAFDRIVLMHVFEHLPEPVAMLRELGRRLAPNGRILITVPNADSKQAADFREHWIGYDMPRHLWHFAPDTLTRLVAKAGLDTVSCETLELKWFADESIAVQKKATGRETVYSAGNLRELEATGRGAEIVFVAQRAANASEPKA